MTDTSKPATRSPCGECRSISMAQNYEVTHQRGGSSQAISGNSSELVAKTPFIGVCQVFNLFVGLGLFTQRTESRMLARNFPKQLLPEQIIDPASGSAETPRSIGPRTASIGSRPHVELWFE